MFIIVTHVEIINIALILLKKNKHNLFQEDYFQDKLIVQSVNNLIISVIFLFYKDGPIWLDNMNNL